MISVVLADDHVVVRTGIKMLLDADPDIEVVAEAAEGTEAYSLVARYKPDVLLLDISMPPGQSGLIACEKTAKDFLKEMFIAMGLIVNVETSLTDKHLEIKISGDDMGIIIGKRGQTLDAIQYLVNLVVNKGTAPYISVTLDTENYRERRKETLETLAHNLARKVKHTGKNVVLEPMNPYERRIIHSSLQNDRYVTTYSEGEEPHRNVVIALKEKKKTAE